MRSIFIFIFLWSPLSAFADDQVEWPAPQCIFGNPNRDVHARAVSGENVDEGSFLEYYIEKRNQRLCTAPFKNFSDIFQMARERLTLGHGLRRECIAKSMMNIKDIQGTYRSDCENDTQSVSSVQGIRSGPNYDTCLTEDMIDYVTFAVNESIRCVNSISDPKVDPTLLFKKINRESKFGYYLRSVRGNGVGQLTTIAMKEMADPKHDGHDYLENALKSEHCQPFHGALSEPIRFARLRGSGDEVVRNCQILNSQNGLARNLFFSMALFVHNRDTHGSAIGPVMRRQGVTSESKINDLTLVSYGRNGLVGAHTAFDIMVDDYGYQHFESYSAEKMEDHIRNTSPETLVRMERHFNSEHNSVVTTADILEYLTEHEPEYLDQIIQEPGINRFNKISNEDFRKDLGSLAPYFKEIEESYDAFLAINKPPDGELVCFAPFGLQ